MKASEVDSRFAHQSRQPIDEVEQEATGEQA